MTLNSAVRLARGFAAALAVATCGGLTLAQVPGVPGLGGTAAKNGVAESGQPTPASKETDVAAELRRRLAAERQQLELLDAPGGLSAGAPPGTDEQSLRLRHIRVAFIVRTLVQQLSDLDKLADVRARRSTLEEEQKSWTGFAEKPPYSILLADRLRAELHAAETELSGLQSRAELLKQTTQLAVDRLKQAEQQLRQLDERAETARTEVDVEQISWARDSTKLMIRALQTSVGAAETTRQLLGEEIAVAQMQIEFARRKLESIAAETRFTADDLARVRATLAAEREKLGAEVDRLTREHTRRQMAADTARQTLEAAKAAATRGGAGSTETLVRLHRLEQDDELQRVRLEASAAQLDQLREATDLNRARETLWEARYAAHQKLDAGSRLATRESAEKMLAFLNSERKHLEQIYRAANARVQDVETRLEDVEHPAEHGFLRELQKAYGERAASLQRALFSLDSNATLAQQIVAEFGGGSDERSWTERREDWWVLAARYATAVWNFELVAVEDTVEVDGRSIVGKRSVTVGKVLNALLLIVAGYALAVFLARLAERTLIRRFAWQPAHAGIVRHWLLAFALAILFIIVLAWVKIPFTVFAFLGGAVAIGLGFGMQTLLKNLISGLMVLGERPFRIGDLVEVSGIRGNVTGIGLRASTISDVNGIETIIPNSTFIEQNLTNWTHTSGHVRFNVKVGVAYGSPVRTVSQLLAEVADRHGLVLKNPAPEVLFEDFASDALVFGLYYWLDIGAGVPARRVASDLRGMIESAFAAQGIVIAFPQRDVHLDVAAPLPVRIVPDAGPPPAPEPAGKLP